MLHDPKKYREIKFKLNLQVLRLLKILVIFGFIAWALLWLFRVYDELMTKPGDYSEKRSVALANIIGSNLWLKFGTELEKLSNCEDASTEYICATSSNADYRYQACNAIKTGKFLKITLRDCLYIGVNNTREDEGKDTVWVVASAQLVYHYPEVLPMLLKIARKPCEHITRHFDAKEVREVRATLQCDNKHAKREKIRINFLDGFLSKERERANTFNDLGTLAFFIEVQRED